jgi:PAS domain S-box-containing protein
VSIIEVQLEPSLTGIKLLTKPVSPWGLFAQAAACFAIATGVAVLVGWAYDIPSLKGMYADITMKANAAICFLLCGVSLLLVNWQRRSSDIHIFGSALAALSVLVGGLTLLQHISGWDFRIDQILFIEPPGALATASPGRMGINASASFTLLGAALLSLYRDRAIVFRQILAITVFLVELLALVGYAYGVDELYGLPQYTGIALHTAVGLAILSLGILTIREKEGFMALVSAATPAGAVVRRLLIWVLALPVLLGWIRVMALQRSYFDTAAGTAVLVVSLVAVFSAVVLRLGRRLGILELEKEQSRAVVRETEERFQSLANEAAVLIWVSDSAGQRMWFNRAWLDFTGKTLELEQDDGWIDQLHEDDRAEYIAAYRNNIQRQWAFSSEFRLKRGDGEYRWLLETGSPRQILAGAFAGFAASCVDITDRKAIEGDRDRLLESERSARLELERVAQLKDEFLATLSHELRTPLNAMLGWSQILQKSKDHSETTIKGLAVIERNARVQTKLIDDLLEMSRILAGKLRLEVQDVNLVGVVEAAIETVRLAAEAKGIRIVSILEPITQVVHGDPQRLQQVVWNVLSNAIKFTPKGGRVQVVLKRANSHAELTVSDTGRGVKPEFLPHLFERFRQADASTTREFGGLGLGLAIVRQMTELHGGRVRAASEGEGKGTTLVIELPLSVVPLSAQADSLSEHPRAMLNRTSSPYVASLAGVMVLVVDDEPDAREMIKQILVDQDASVLVAGSAEEARNLLKTQKPDVILSDIGMPAQDGYEFLSDIRRAGNEIPAAAITAFARSEDRIKALQAGFQMHLAKPIEPAELLAAVASLAQGLTGNHFSKTAPQ